MKYFEHICRDPEQRSAMRARASASFQEFPTWDVTARRLIAFVTQEVLREK